jgi:hypothetical protein
LFLVLMNPLLLLGVIAGYGGGDVFMSSTWYAHAHVEVMRKRIRCDVLNELVQQSRSRAADPNVAEAIAAAETQLMADGA